MNKLESEYNEIEENDLWSERFQNLRSTPWNYTITQAKHPMNSRYNRYRDILPYDHSRVKLKEANDTDYINANLVECKEANRFYILAQGPLKNTCEHFWQMIWEQNTLGIVMLNKLIEKGSSKCEMYYPNLDEENSEETLEFGKFRLNYMSERPFTDFAIRVIECENMEQKEKRQIYHCHFTNWPDFGEPEYPTTFLNFLRECESLNIFNKDVCGPCVVHCSAGVGRSGTFILVDSMLQIYKLYGNELPVNILDLLNELRTYRMGLVQTSQQLRFAYRAIIEGIKELNELATTGANGRVMDQVIISDSDTDDNDSSERDDEDDDDEDDDDFYEDEKGASNRSVPRKQQRPGTAASGTKRTASNRIKPSSRMQKHTKQLRQLQMNNRADAHHEDNEFTELKTAINNQHRELLLSDDSNKKPNSSSDFDYSENDIHENDVIENDDDDDDEQPFARREVSTVKVNEPRKLPVEHENQPTTDIIDPNSTADNNTKPKPTSAKHLSEREQNLAKKVSNMKQKQMKYEQRKQFLDNLRPILVGGGVLLTGLIIHQIYKRFFF